MSFSRPNTNFFDMQISADISYVIRQCVLCNCLASFRGVSKSTTHNIYEFEFTELPRTSYLNYLSNYFDSMSIDVNKERVIIKLTIDFTKDIPF